MRGAREDRPAGRRRLRASGRSLAGALSVLIAGFAVLTARLFDRPPQGVPARADAIVMLDGPGDRLAAALRLGREHRAPVLVLSQGRAWQGQPSDCTVKIPGVRMICFNPSPATTQGEAEFAGRLARRYHWHSIVLVTTTPQDTRARLRLSRCFRGSIYVVTAPLPAAEWPYTIAYEWGATVKALVLQRSC